MVEQHATLGDAALDLHVETLHRRHDLAAFVVEDRLGDDLGFLLNDVDGVVREQCAQL